MGQPNLDTTQLISHEFDVVLHHEHPNDPGLLENNVAQHIAALGIATGQVLRDRRKKDAVECASDAQCLSALGSASEVCFL